MSKGKVLSGSICLVLLFVCIGCTIPTKSIDNPVEFETVKVDTIYHLLGDTAKPACHLQIEFQYPVSEQLTGEQLKAIQELFIEKTLGVHFTSYAPAEAVQAYVRSYLDSFKRFELNTDPEEFMYEDLEFETDFFYYTSLKNEITFNQNQLISFKVEQVSYEGGAHPSQSINGYVIDLNKSSLIDKNDFEGNQYEKQIAGLLVEAIARKNKLFNPKDLENIGYTTIDDIVPNNNFTIDQEGITYYFNENEIAGYMVGLTVVPLTWDNVRAYMSNENPFSSIY